MYLQCTCKTEVTVIIYKIMTLQRNWKYYIQPEDSGKWPTVYQIMIIFVFETLYILFISSTSIVVTRETTGVYTEA